MPLPAAAGPHDVGLLAYAFGCRHGVDADHIAAIDNVTRRPSRRPRDDGRRLFSLGHCTVVPCCARRRSRAPARFGCAARAAQRGSRHRPVGGGGRAPFDRRAQPRGGARPARGVEEAGGRATRTRGLARRPVLPGAGGGGRRAVEGTLIGCSSGSGSTPPLRLRCSRSPRSRSSACRRGRAGAAAALRGGDGARRLLNGLLMLGPTSGPPRTGRCIGSTSRIF